MAVKQLVGQVMHDAPSVARPSAQAEVTQEMVQEYIQGARHHGC